jgi:hypothetical protein
MAAEILRHHQSPDQKQEGDNTDDQVERPPHMIPHNASSWQNTDALHNSITCSAAPFGGYAVR